MRHVPPTYEGRPLAKPDEELVDQGLGFDLGTLLSRRQVLRTFGLSATALGVAACSGGSGSGSASSSAATTTTSTASTSASVSASATATGAAGAIPGEIPDETDGPFPGDGSNGPDILEQSGVVRSDIRTSIGDASGTAEGVPMTLELTVSDLAKNGAPFAGVAVYVWQCDREGRYSMYSDGATDQNYLRGVQVADAGGRVRFTTIFPACYPGRWPHIHFEVYPTQASIADATSVIATSQVAIPQQACDAVYATPGYEQSVATLSELSLETDNVFRDDGGASQLGTVSGNASGGYVLALAVGVDTRTTPAR